MEDGRYPLEPVQELRHHECAARETSLREELSVLAEAEAALDRAREALHVHRHETRALSSRPLVPSERTAEELLRDEAFLSRRRDEDRLLTQRFVEARQAAEQAAAATEKARTALSRAHAAQKALEKHRARWESQIAKRHEKREEQEIADFLSRRRFDGT